MRIELIHPIIVGLPISFLILGSFIRLSCIFFKKKVIYPQLLAYAHLLIVIGIISGFLAVFTGELAQTIVGEHLCDPKILDYHEALGFTMLMTYTLAYLLDRAGKWNRMMEILAIILFCIGPLLLILTGYFGGKLVFEQGAAVEKICDKKSSN